MPSSTICWGIELGAGAVKAIKLERDGDNLKVLDFAVIPHKLVFSTPELDLGEATRVALGTLVSQYDLSGAAIAVSVPGHSAFARFAKLPPVEPRKIPDIVKFEAVQQIPFPIDDVEWDFQTFASSDSPDVEVGIFAITRDKVNERLATWADVGITPDFITLSPIAVFNAIAYDMSFSGKTPGTVILDVGNTSTDLIVAEAGRVWVRTFPIGGHQFTEALVEAFKLTYAKAEKLKREAETSKHARHVFQAMRPVFGDLAQDVQRSIGYYQSLHRDANLTRLVGLGSTFNLPGLRKYLSQQLQMEVIRPEQFSRLSMEGPRAAELQAATINLATVYGLALQGLGLAAIDANLIPKAVVREAMWRRKVKWFGVAAGLSIVAGAMSFGRYFMDRNRVDASPPPAVIAKTVQQLRALRADWKKVEDAYKADYAAANAALLLDGRDIFPHIVDDLGQSLAYANQKAADLAKTGKPADSFMFGKFETRYNAGAEGYEAGPESPGSPAAPPPPRRPQPPEDDGLPGAKRGAAPKPKPAAPLPPPPREPTPTDPGAVPPDGGYLSGEGPPRVSIVLTVSTARPDAEQFVHDTLQQWLNQNRQRENVPYTIKNVNWKRIGQEEIPKDKDATPPGGPGTPDNPGAPLPSPPGEGRGKGSQPGNVPPGAPRFKPDGTPIRYDKYGNAIADDIISTADAARPRREGGYSEPGGGERTGGQGQGDLERLAPVPKPPPKAEPGSKVTTFEVTWDAVLKLKAKEGTT